MPKSILGTRIRERRRAMGVTQAEMSRRIGISASYLNLIERNKRGIAGPLLRRAAAALELRLDELDDAAERRLLETLNEIAAAPDIAALGVEAASAGELIGRYPGWARALGALARSERAATMEVQALSDRMTHDTFLVESVHRMLTRVAAIRSAAEILTEYPDAPADRRDQFLGIVSEESRVLTDVCEALSAYFDKARESSRSLTPLDEVEALFEARDNHFDSIELEAASLTGLLDDGTPAPRRALARALAAERLGPLIDAIIAGQPEIQTTRARDRARAALLDYATGAILAPMPAFRPRAAALALRHRGARREFRTGGGDGLPAAGGAFGRGNAAFRLFSRQRRRHDRRAARIAAPRRAALCPGLPALGALPRPAVAGGRHPPAGALREWRPLRVHRPGPQHRPDRLRQAAALPDRHAGDDRGGRGPDRLCSGTRRARRGSRPGLPHLSAPRLPPARR